MTWLGEGGGGLEPVVMGRKLKRNAMREVKKGRREGRGREGRGYGGKGSELRGECMNSSMTVN